MSPRGVAIPDLRRRLFDATDRVLERHGPGGLNSRAITTEAGTATGLLFRHFEDFDAFLAAFVVDRMAQVHALARGWQSRAGSSTVEANLTDAALSLVPIATRLFEVVHARPSLVSRFVANRLAHVGGLEDIERSLAAYLDAERAIGRIHSATDTGAVALALAASIHELSIRYAHLEAELDPRIRRVVTALATQMRPETMDG